jgi:hypothetical protein
MKRLIACWVALTVAIFAFGGSYAGSPTLLGGGKFVAAGGGGGGITWTALSAPAGQDAGFGNNPSQLTFSSTLGTGLIVVGVGAETGASGMSTVTVDGVSATEHVEAIASTKSVAVYSAASTSASGNIVITAVGGFNLGKAVIAVGLLTGANATPTSTASRAYGFSDTGVAITVPTSGIAIAFAGLAYGSGSNTWTNATEDVATATPYGAGGFTARLAHFSTAGATTITYANGSNGSGLAIVAWGP